MIKINLLGSERQKVKKKVAFLSGGERARLCLAGLMLGTYNVLILDEPGNHLDVESVDSLAEALACSLPTPPGIPGDQPRAPR